MIGDATAGCGELDLVGVGASPEQVSWWLMTLLVPTNECWPSFIAFRELVSVLRMPVEDQRNGRNDRLHGHIDQEAAVGRHRVLVPEVGIAAH